MYNFHLVNSRCSVWPGATTISLECFRIHQCQVEFNEKMTVADCFLYSPGVFFVTGLFLKRLRDQWRTNQN